MAAQAAVDIGLRFGGGQVFFQHILHQVDASARRIHLFAEQVVGRASGQAEAAMHALLDRFGHFRRAYVITYDLMAHF